MTRHAKPNLDHFDPDVIEAARDVADRAGIPLEDWIAANVPGIGRRQREERRPAQGRQQGADQSGRQRGRGEDRRIEALISRMDRIDRALRQEAAPARAESRLEEIEARIVRALESGAQPARAVSERLGDIERRMSELGDQFASARPYARRGRAAASEIRDAVQEIRLRQREIGNPAASDANVVADLRRDLARRLDAGLHEDVMAETAAAVSELRHEAMRLRESIGALATSRDVGALEQAMISLATGVERAEPSADFAAIAEPIAEIRTQIERLAGEVSDNVHARVSREVEHLAERIESVAARPVDAPEASALAGLSRELDEIRNLIAALAGPERIQSLATGLQAISTQIAQLQMPPASDALVDEVRAMTAKLDAFQAHAGHADQAASRAIIGRIDALAHKVEQASGRAVAEAGAQTDADGTVVRAASLPGGDVASIHAMLNTLVEKVERVGARPGSDGLDALERQLVSLTDRIDSRSSDPTLASLEQTMGDLLQQVTALRESAPDEAALERAARKAVAASAAEPRAEDRGEIGLLRAGLADLQARQTASDQRLGTMLDGVQTALDRLMTRLDAAEGGLAAQPGLGVPVPSLAEQLMASAAEAPRPLQPRRPAAPQGKAKAPSKEAPLSRTSEELLEPGAGRPGRDAARERPAPERGLQSGEAEPAEAGENAADIKSSFIAAARRAAQAAQAELATEATAERDEIRPGARSARAAAPTPEGRLARLRAEIDRRRRPLLLGLAAIVLALGALQAITMHTAEENAAPIVAAGPARPEAGRAPEQVAGAKVEGPKIEGSKAEAGKPETGKAVPDPQTTQAIPANPSAARPRSGVPQVTSMASLNGDLAAVPAAMAKLKQQALDGDGTAIWDLAMRAADGRGMPRDLALSAKLYEKLAAAGFAPAQYKLAGQYEKGAGLVRDLTPAKLWYGRAAEQGHARSMHNLAVIYAENPTPTGKPDYASAASWFRQGAEHGVRDSQYNLGVLYARGLGVGQDLVQSYAWFSAAAAQGDEDAGKKRDEVAGKLSPADLASARSIAGAFKPRKLDPAVNDAPSFAEPPAAVTLLGAPSPSPNAFVPTGRDKKV